MDEDAPCTGEPPKPAPVIVADETGLHLTAVFAIDFYADPATDTARA